MSDSKQKQKTDAAATATLGPIVLACQPVKRSTAALNKGGTYIQLITLPALLGFVSTGIIIGLISQLNLPRGQNLPLAFALLTWLIVITGSLYGFMFSRPESYLIVHERGFRHKKNIFEFDDIHSISGSRADTRETSLLDFANPLSRLTRALELSKQATLEIRLKTRDTWPLKNVLAEFEPADIEKFLAFADQNLPAVSVSVAEVAAHSLSTSQIE